MQVPRVLVFALALGVVLRDPRPLRPSVLIGVTLAFLQGVAVGAGLWAAWWQVQLASGVSWVVVLVLGWRTRDE